MEFYRQLTNEDMGSGGSSGLRNARPARSGSGSHAGMFGDLSGLGECILRLGGGSGTNKLGEEFETEFLVRGRFPSGEAYIRVGLQDVKLDDTIDDERYGIDGAVVRLTSDEYNTKDFRENPPDSIEHFCIDPESISD